MRGFPFLFDSKVARISDAYSRRMNISLEEAMRQFMASGTYRALSDAESGLFLEVFECVYDMFLEDMGVVFE
jgi:hypothetical protein